jgi:hypothetical protein
MASAPTLTTRGEGIIANASVSLKQRTKHQNNKNKKMANGKKMRFYFYV